MHQLFRHTDVRIRPLASQDTSSLLNAVRESSETIGRWMDWCHANYSIDDANQWIERCLLNWRTEGAGVDREFGIFEVDSGGLLGCVGVNQINLSNNFANLGYWVRSSATGQGIASTAALMAARFAFTELKLSRLEVVVRVDNMASRRVAEKLGGQFEGIARNRLRFKGNSYDAAMYSLLPQDIAD